MGGPIDMKQKRYESVPYWTYHITLTFDPIHDLDWFSRSNFETAVS